MKHKLVTLVLGEATVTLPGELLKPAALTSAPVYSETAVPRPVVAGQETADIDGQPVTFYLRHYLPNVLLVRADIAVDNVFQKSIHDLEKKVYQHAHRILQSHGGSAQFSEEYSVFVVTGYEGAPEQFLEHQGIMTSLLKSEKMELDPREVQYTLGSQIKYAKNDLSIIDWDGAFLFDPQEDVEEDLEILTLANLQLLRHRIFDRDLDERLARMANMVQQRSRGRMLFQSKELAGDLKEIIQTRMASISDLQRIERDIKLIGDWYSARFYDLAANKFKIEDWRRSIRGKLESLEDVYSLVVENFTVSSKHRAEWIQIIAFFVLQVGWAVLIILELKLFYLELQKLSPP